MDCATSAVPMVAAADPMATPTMVPLTPKNDAMLAATTAPVAEARTCRMEMCTAPGDLLIELLERRRHGPGDELAGPGVEHPIVAEAGDRCGETRHHPQGPVARGQRALETGHAAVRMLLEPE